MHRLFVALELPPAIRDVLLAQMGGIAGARWQRDDQLHLTLRFVGEVDRHVANDIVAALGAVVITPFKLGLDGWGTFVHKTQVDTLWAGVTPHTYVAALARRIDEALHRVGVERPTRAFLPHITVARLGRSAGPVAGFVTRLLPAAVFQVSHFGLWESTLGTEGADYRVIERFRG